MLGRIALWLAERLAKEKFVILRAGPPGSPVDPYLTRYTLLGKRFEGTWGVYLHHFHRSDQDDPHNHPWNFVSVILSGGYWEKTPASGQPLGSGRLQRRWYGPGRILRRPATWVHAVEVPGGSTPVVTLIFRGPKRQSWGFFCKHGYRPWRDYLGQLAAGHDGCA